MLSEFVFLFVLLFVLFDLFVCLFVCCRRWEVMGVIGGVEVEVECVRACELFVDDAES